MKNIKKVLYKAFCIFDLWYYMISQNATKERANKIYERWADYQMSALYLFLGAVVTGLTLGIYLHFAFIFLILLFGLQLPLVMITIHYERDRYWTYRRQDMDERHKREREESERRWKETMRDFEESLRRQREEAQRRRDAEWDNIRHEFRAGSGNQRQGGFNGRHQAPPRPKAPSPVGIEGDLAVLGLPSYCRDMKTVKQAYRNLMKKYHPDVNKAPNAEAKFIEVKKAYDALEAKLK